MKTKTFKHPFLSNRADTILYFFLQNPSLVFVLETEFSIDFFPPSLLQLLTKLGESVWNEYRCKKVGKEDVCSLNSLHLCKKWNNQQVEDYTLSTGVLYMTHFADVESSKITWFSLPREWQDQ